MSDAYSLGAIGLGIFAASAAVGYVLHGGWVQRPVPPPQNTRIRLKKGASVYACHLLEANRRSWLLTAPRTQSDVVAIRPGGTLIAEFTLPEGIAVFATRVVGRQHAPDPAIWIEAPCRIAPRERRNHPRMALNDRVSAQLGSGALCRIRDLGTAGAKVISTQPVVPGDLVALTPKDSAVTACGWALECRETDRAAYPYVVRIVFDPPMTLDWVMQFV